MAKPFIKNLLLFYKTSTLEHSSDQKTPHKSIKRKSSFVSRFKGTHIQHYKTLKMVELILKQHGIPFRKLRRGQKADFSKYDMIFTIGGDGTVLEAARKIKNQTILGINSDPQWSVGKLCHIDSRNVKLALKKVLSGQFKILVLNRLTLKIKGTRRRIHFLNDILICNRNPAAISRYIISINTKKEEQISSGLWISTASGSTGAMRSSGGKVLPRFSKNFQYRPRELYCGKKASYRLKGGILYEKDKLKFISYMKEGNIYVDGAHFNIPFSFGEEATIEQSPYPLNMIVIQ